MAVILRIGLWHLLLLLLLLAVGVPAGFLEGWGLGLGGLFMGINFLLLSYGVRWLLGPLADKRRVRVGVALLVSKLVFFLGGATAGYLWLRFDVLSFAAGVSCLLVAVVFEGLWSYRSYEEVPG